MRVRFNLSPISVRIVDGQIRVKRGTPDPPAPVDLVTRREQLRDALLSRATAKDGGGALLWSLPSEADLKKELREVEAELAVR
jgi:hypothetical protein